MSDASMKIDIPGVDFSAMARDAIAVKLTESLVGSNDAIRKIVVAAMERKVDERGNVNTSSYYNTTPFVQWMAEDLIRSAVLEVLQHKVEQLRPVIEKSVEAELRRSSKAHAKALTESFINQAKSGYGLTTNVTMQVKADRD